MHKHVRDMAVFYMSVFLVLWLLRTAGVDVLGNKFFETLANAAWVAGVAMAMALLFGRKVERRAPEGRS